MRPPSSSYQTQEANIGAVGNVTGSKEWQDSGKKDAQEGINEMKVSQSSFLFIDLENCMVRVQVLC